ncbi:AAA family ATPase [Specibacter sp. NPDC078692]|uniref:AAA family ATPase n=1 Tax=Specibacter sp. NPDC078692 TaxID=3155818 RepID=UPI00341516F2
MANDVKVTIYFGPLSWFEQCVGKKKKEGLLEAVFAREENLRQLRVVLPEDSSNEDRSKPKRKRPKRLIAESGDYASLQEHAITNFPGLVQVHNPKELHLHNPPEQVHEHLKRIYSSTLEVVSYDYPAITRSTLVQFRDQFAQHLIGQENVKESLLAALYPLTRSARTKPVVIMFYGPSGVGKTETAKFINGLLGGALMRKQFSMFHNEKFASYLFGGGHSEPSFAHDLLDRESGVVLIDEFDKAASVFHSAFYQFFDGGVFQDKNYRVDVGRSLIICTSNYDSEKEIRDALGDALYSRFDALIKFDPLSKNEITAVIDRLVDVRFEALVADERQIVDATQVKEKLYPLALHPANVRKIGKITDELISTLLVRTLICQDPPLAENTDATDSSR